MLHSRAIEVIDRDEIDEIELRQLFTYVVSTRRKWGARKLLILQNEEAKELKKILQNQIRDHTNGQEFYQMGMFVECTLLKLLYLHLRIECVAR